MYFIRVGYENRTLLDNETFKIHDKLWPNGVPSDLSQANPKAGKFLEPTFMLGRLSKLNYSRKTDKGYYLVPATS